MKSELPQRIVDLIDQVRPEGAGAADLRLESALPAIGLNSLSFIRLLVLIEKELAIEFEIGALDINRFRTVNDIIELIQERISSSPRITHECLEEIPTSGDKVRCDRDTDDLEHHKIILTEDVIGRELWQHFDQHRDGWVRLANALIEKNDHILEISIEAPGMLDIATKRGEYPGDLEDFSKAYLGSLGHGASEYQAFVQSLSARAVRSPSGAARLPIRPAREAVAWADEAFYLSVLLADNRYLAWYHNSYVNIIGDTIDTPKIARIAYLSPIDYDDCFDNLLNIEYRANILDDILDFVRLMIINGYYLIVFADEFYIPECKSYKIRHFLHQILIYGFDDIKGVLFGVSYDKENIFRQIEFECSSFVLGFQKGREYCQEQAPWARGFYVRTFSPKKQTVEMAFDISRYLARLRRYLKPYRINIGNDIGIGIEAYDIALKALEQPAVFGDLVYQSAHFLYEHKKKIYSSLKYLVDDLGYGSLSGLVEQYHPAVQTFDAMRLTYLRQAVLENRLVPGSDGCREKMRQLLIEGRKIEDRILPRVMEELTAGLGSL